MNRVWTVRIPYSADVAVTAASESEATAKALESHIALCRKCSGRVRLTRLDRSAVATALTARMRLTTAERLTRLIDAGFTQTQIARYTGVPQACISRIVSGLGDAAEKTSIKIEAFYSLEFSEG